MAPPTQTADPIDQFIALPPDQQLSTMQQLDSATQQKFLAQVSQRQSGKATAPVRSTDYITAPPTLRQKLTDMFTHPLNSLETASQPINRPRDATMGEMLNTDLYNVGAGAAGVVRHPLDTVAGILAGIGGVFTAPVESMMGQENEFQQLFHEADTNGPQMGATMVGQSLAVPAVTKVLAPVAAPLLNVAAKAVGIVPKIAKGGANILAGTTPELAQKLGAETQAANVAAEAKAAKANADLQTQRAADLQKHFAKTQTVREANPGGTSSTPMSTRITEGSTPTPSELASRKVALERGVEQLDPKFQDDLKATEQSVRAQANAKYNTVRAATAGETVPSASLADAVKSAESKIQGSSENLKIFRDILSKHPEGEPESISYQGAEIPKGHPLYDVLAEGENAASSPATFSDLQGYYTELGNQLAKGNLPGDVYQAMKSLQGGVGDLMQQMAESKGVGGALTDARSFYSRYMDAFRDPASPLYKAINAPEAGHLTKGAIAKLQGMDKSGIETLAQYNPDLAKRANTIRGYQAEAKSIPTRTAAPKPEPTLAPAPPPVLADIKKIGLKDIQEAKQSVLQNRKGPVGGRIGHLASGAGSWHIISSLMYGNPEGALVGGAVAATPHALGALFRNPAIVRILSEPTPADIAAIPPEVRAEMPQIVRAAQMQGIKVHPTLLAIGGSAAQQAQPQ